MAKSEKAVSEKPDSAGAIVKMIDLFSGLGGFHYAAEQVWDEVECVLHCEIEPFCQKVLKKHWPDTPIVSDIHDLTAKKIKEFTDGAIVDLLTGGPPCFQENTLILTKRGYLPIKDVIVNDRVLTHKRKWQKVTHIGSRITKKSLKVYATGTHGLWTTHNHPFYAGTLKYRYPQNPKPRKRLKEITEIRWEEASSLKNKDFLSMTLPPERDCGLKADFWWLVGRYLADGWRVKRYNRKNSGRVVICCNKTESQFLLSKIKDAGFNATLVSERTVDKYHIQSTWLYKYLGPFGRGADGKKLTIEALSLSKENSYALCEGYFSGDGYKIDKGIGCSTVSKFLAYGISIVAEKAYGVVVSVKCYKPKAKKQIEGRTVNQKPMWQLWIPLKNRYCIKQHKYSWKPFRKVEEINEPIRVYNLAVEEDESYVADGAIVHNCQPSSIAGQRRGTEDDRWLWPEVIRIIKTARPRWIFCENPTGINSLSEPICDFKVESRQAQRFSKSDVYNSVLSRQDKLHIANIIEEIEKAGYGFPEMLDGTPILWIIPACAVNAPHKRDRVWFVAHTSSERCDNAEKKNGQFLQDKDRNGASAQQIGKFIEPGVGESNCFAADFKSKNDRRYSRETAGGQVQKPGNGSFDGNATDFESQQKRKQNNEKNAIPGGRETREVPGCGSGGVGTVTPKSNGTGREKQVLTSRIQWDRHWIDVAAELCRLDDGLPSRLARRERQAIYRAIKCLGREEAEKTLGVDLRKAEEHVNRTDAIKAYGNSIVPQVAVEIMRAIKYAEENFTR